MSNFTTMYQDLKVKDDPTNNLNSSFYRRYCAYLAHVQTLTNNCNQTSSLVLQEKLKEYCDFIDDRNGINNFATVALSLSDHIDNVSKSWKSGIEKMPPPSEIMPQASGTCANQSVNGCTALGPSNDDVVKFFNTLATCRNSDKRVPTIREVKKQEDFTKSSLFSTYDNPSNTAFPNNQPAARSAFGRYDQERNYHTNRSEVDRLGPVQRPAHSGRGMPNRFARGKVNYDNEEDEKPIDSFKTAGQALKIQLNQKKFNSGAREVPQFNAPVKKSLGGKGRIVSNKFVPPLRSAEDDDVSNKLTRAVFKNSSESGGGNFDEELDERLKHIDPKMIELIQSEIMDCGAKINWDDIAGLDFAKRTIQEIVVWPMLRPDIFTGLRRPPKGILLFGPPGTGKTLIGKCIASQSNSTFFSISASSLTSKWIGDGEKMVRALFAVARVHQPAVIFIDEIDSLLSQRSEQEHESSRRIKTEFLVQLDGAATGDEDRLLIIGATNRPQELDEAARRRLVKRLYIPLPDSNARKHLVTNLMTKERNSLSTDDLDQISVLTDGYSGADMKNLCQEASLGPIRSISISQMASISADQVRPVNMEDFKSALQRVRSSVSDKDLDTYITWNKQFGMSC